MASGIYQLPPDWDFRLANVFQDFRYLSVIINRNVVDNTRYNAVSFQSFLTSLQSRLMHLSGLLNDSLEESVRLTLLAFLTTTFKVPGRKIPYGWVVEQLGEAYSKVQGGLYEQNRSLCLWILITAAFTVAGAQQDWIRKAWEIADSRLDWPSVKQHLVRVIWIDIIHDRPGERTFEQLSR